MTVLQILIYVYLLSVTFGVLYVAWKIKRWVDREEIHEIRLRREEWPPKMH